MANDITPKHEIYNTGIELHDISGWSRHTVADGKWLNINTIKPVSADLNILASAIHDTSGALEDDVNYLSANIDNLSGELYDTSSYLNEEIIKINARADVIDVVGSYANFVDKYLTNFDPASVSDQDVVKILNDETSANAQTYYRWLSADDPVTGTWTGVGSLEPYYNNANISNGILTVNNTNIERNYTLSGEKYIELNGNGKTGAFGLTDEFISSASQCYTALTSHSASWDETSATLNENSGYWDQAYTALTSTSAGWNKTSAWVYNNSANIVDASATLYNNSANWQATYSAVSSNSAIWNESAYVPLSALECKIGSANTVEEYSFVQGSGNNAEINSFAQGRDNIASDKSFAQGSANTAVENGFARGLKNHADAGFANGTDNTAMGAGSLAIGANNYAGTYAQALGHGVNMKGSSNVPARGGMAIGTYNKTSADLAFVIGNGTNDSNRSDLYWIDYNGNVYTNGNISATNFYINGNPIDSVVSAKFSAYNGDTKIAELPISAFKLQANTAKYISATTAANTMIFNVSDALINSASSGYQAKQWINASGDSIVGSAKSGAAASAWIKTNGNNIIGSANSGAAASAYIATNGVGTKVGGYDQYGFYQYDYLILDPITRGLYTDPNDFTNPIGYYVPTFDSADSGKVLIVNDAGDKAEWDYPDPAGTSEVEIEVGEIGGYTKIINAIASGNTPVLVKTGSRGDKYRYIFTEKVPNGGGYKFVQPAANNVATSLYTYTVQTGDVYDSKKYDSIPKPDVATIGNIAIFDGSKRVIDSLHGFTTNASGDVKTMASGDYFAESQQINSPGTGFTYWYIGNTVRRIAVGITNNGNVRIGEETGGSSSPTSEKSIIWSTGTGDNTIYHFNGSALGATYANSAKYANTANSALNASLSRTANTTSGDILQIGTGTSARIVNAGNAYTWNTYKLSYGTFSTAAKTISIV